MIISPHKSFDLIHIGKCGGITAASALKQAGYTFEHIHVQRPVPRSDAEYVLLVRDPVSRFVSAFNWRKHLYRSGRIPQSGPTDPSMDLLWRTEREFLFRFDTADDLARELSRHDLSTRIATAGLMWFIGHVSMGFQWHLGHLLDHIEPRQIIGIVCAECFSSDFKQLFGFSPDHMLNRGDDKLSTHLSKDGRLNLVHEFQLEYNLLMKLKKLADASGIVMSMRYDPLSGAVPVT